MQLREGLDTYDLEWSFDEPLSVHVLETDEATILFGGGSEETADALVEIARDHDVDVVVVEHGDADHFGAVPALREALSDLTVAAPAGDAVALDEAGVETDRNLQDGETYWGVETIDAPGHTPGNMAYRHGDVLVAGDTVAGADSPFAAPGDWSGAFAVITPDYNADDDQARASVSRLLEFEFETVLVSHGSNVTEDGRGEIETLVADLEG